MNSAYPQSWDKLYEKTISSLHIGLFRTNPAGEILDADQSLVHILHFPDVDSLRKTNAAAIWNNPAELDQYIRQLNSGQDIKLGQVSLRCYDHTLIWVELSAYAVKDDQGNILYYEGALQDISQRIAADQEHQKTVSRLETNEHIFRALIENSTDGMMVIDRNGKIKYNSPSTSPILGFPPEQNLGKNFSQFIHPDDLSQTRESLEISLNKPGTPVSLLFRSAHQDGSWRWIEGKANNQLNDPAVQGIIFNYHDISEQKKAENRLQDAETRNRYQIDNLAALLKVEKAITSRTEIGSVMNVVLEQATNQLGMDAAVILLYDIKSSSLYFGSGRGFKPGRATTALRYLQNPLLERVVKERQMLHMPIPHEWQDIWGNEGFSVYFGVPLVAKGEVNGVLELYHRSEFEPSEDWLTFMFMIAEVSAIAIDNVSLFQNLQRSNRELQQAYDTTLEGWARALELRHQETKDHSIRIVNWFTRLAKMFGIDEDALVHLKRGALLHDIGKMGIPDSILNKTGPLISDEWVVMRRHPQLAYDMLYPIQYLRPSLDIPYCHHEWWDGSGYPRGLKGEAIPLAARIFTVVDIWDAITQDRKYRPEPERRWDKRRAMEYLIDQSGKKLDPRVVKAFLHLLESS